MIAVVYYFQMKHDQATSQTEVIHLDAEVKTTAAATKTAEASKKTSETASSAADLTVTHAINDLITHM